MRLCKDCKWYVPVENTYSRDCIDKCIAPESFNKVSLVREEKVQKTPYCTTLRENDEYCGAAANWFEPKEESKPEQEQKVTE